MKPPQRAASRNPTLLSGLLYSSHALKQLEQFSVPRRPGNGTLNSSSEFNDLKRKEEAEEDDEEEEEVYFPSDITLALTY